MPMQWFQRDRFKIFNVVCLALLLTCGFSSLAFAAQGDEEFNRGREAEARQDFDEAFAQYEKALQVDPSNPQFDIAYRRARFIAGQLHMERGFDLRLQGSLQEALAEFETAAKIDTTNPAAQQEMDRTRELIEAQSNPPAIDEGMPSVEDAQGPPLLIPLSREPINLRVTNDSKIVYTTIGRLAGINVLFDPDFTAQRVTVELENVTLEEALDQLSLLSKSFWKTLTRNTILVIPDTAVKRREQEQQVLKTFYLSNTITPQELTEVVTAIRTLLETRRIQQINSMNAILVRDTPDKVALAEKIIRDIDKAKPEVVVDVAVMEIRRDEAQRLGFFPTSSGGAGISTSINPTPRGSTTGTGTSQTTSPNLPLNRLGSLSAADFSIILPGAQLNALMSDANSKVLQRPEIRASDGQKATLRIGDRIPIATGSYQPGVGGAVVSSLVQTQFQYTDVGVNLDITPKVHAEREITLKVRVEISAVTNEKNIGGITQPVIGQRVIEHDIRLKEGEINILGGIFQRQTVESVSGIPGLSSIPLLRYLFSNVSDTIAENEILIVLRPYVVRRMEISDLNRMALDTGTEGSVRLRLTQPPLAVGENVPVETPASPVDTPAQVPGPGAKLLLNNPVANPKPGETVELPLMVENANDVSTVSLEVQYDPAILQLLRVSSGGFLGQGNQPVTIVERAEENSGKLQVTLSRPPKSEPVSGQGTLAVLIFQAAQSGVSPLQITSSLVGSSSSSKIPVPGTQATVTVQ
ncbi:MAG: hypothetical protein A3F68_09085 [Acidobacteria bacterium RIFCSPLOWO2_12_FULL_54_10]|nr:MAG: hypothetical protein A3F68_09085 [Acidobacteria bacterium RIFCSPLOWO2_12_FULL_54_10]